MTFESPVVILAERLGGNEDIPAGVVAGALQRLSFVFVSFVLSTLLSLSLQPVHHNQT
jgi:hypothetical protein